MTRRWPVTAAGLAVLWLFVRGVRADPANVLGEFLIGLGFGVPLAFVFRRLYTERIDLARTLRAVPYAALYVAAFLWELVTANVDVAYRVLSPSMPIEPDVIVLPLRVESDLAITTIANSITLTPGTLTMDYDETHNALYVHAIDGRDPAGVAEPIRRWEDYALVIFDEDRNPGDPIPEPEIGVAGAGRSRIDDGGRDAATDDPGTEGGDERGR